MGSLLHLKEKHHLQDYLYSPFLHLNDINQVNIQQVWSPLAFKICLGNSSTGSLAVRPPRAVNTQSLPLGKSVSSFFRESWMSRAMKAAQSVTLQMTPATDAAQCRSPGELCDGLMARGDKEQTRGVLQLINSRSFLGKGSFVEKQQAQFLPTCNLIFYFPLHMQGLHVNGSVPNEARAGDPPVGLAEPVLFILITAINHKRKGVKHFTCDLATKWHSRELALAL